MAKITITIEDLPNGNVKVVCSPTFEEMMKNHAAKKGLTSAHGYAIAAANAIYKNSKKFNTNRLPDPR